MKYSICLNDCIMVLNTCLGISTGWDETQFKILKSRVTHSLQNLTLECVLRLSDGKNLLQTRKDILENKSLVNQINISLTLGQRLFIFLLNWATCHIFI